MDPGLKDKVVLISGSYPELGTANVFASEGAIGGSWPQAGQADK